MKTIILALTFTAFALSVQSQDLLDHNINYYTLYRFGDKNTCKYRGHISDGVIMTHAVNSQYYYIDTDTSTILVRPGGIVGKSKCMRCKNWFEIEKKETREIIWQKNKKQ